MIKIAIMSFLSGLISSLPVVGGLASTVFNASQNSQANSDNRQFSLDMYNRQRSDALADRDFANFYNSPAEQVKRLVAAGLNPALVYGNGNATPASSSVRGADASPGSNRPASVDPNWLGNAILQVQDTQVKQAQTDNYKMAIEAAKAEILAKTAATSKLEQDTRFAAQLQPGVLEGQRANINKVLADTSVSLDANDRAAAMQNYTIAGAVESILSSRQGRAKSQEEIQNLVETRKTLRNTAVLQQLDINLKKLGIQPGDALWQRVLGQLFSNGNAASAIGDKAKRIAAGVVEATGAESNDGRARSPITGEKEPWRSQYDPR